MGCHWVCKTVTATKLVLFEFLFLEPLVLGHHFLFDILIMLGWKVIVFLSLRNLHPRLLVKQSSMLSAPWHQLTHCLDAISAT